MAGTMSRVKSLIAIGLIVFASACGTDSPSAPPAPGAGESAHTLQELCDFPKQFFSEQFNAADVEATLVATKPLTEKIGTANGCSYRKSVQEGGGYLGHTLLRLVTSSSSPSSAGGQPDRTVTVDGVAVLRTADAVPDYQDAATARPAYTLTARIDGWEGTLGFEGGDERGTQAGAQVLVRMIRALKG